MQDFEDVGWVEEGRVGGRGLLDEGIEDAGSSSGFMALGFG